VGWSLEVKKVVGIRVGAPGARGIKLGLIVVLIVGENEGFNVGFIFVGDNDTRKVGFEVLGDFILGFKEEVDLVGTIVGFVDGFTVVA
jgi:hypothetical protein